MWKGILRRRKRTCRFWTESSALIGRKGLLVREPVLHKVRSEREEGQAEFVFTPKECIAKTGFWFLFPESKTFPLSFHLAAECLPVDRRITRFVRKSAIWRSLIQSGLKFNNDNNEKKYNFCIKLT
ncbi:hypothetical protein TNIN_190791 [Trichonephila inaurata madagascariensis]|uniref:Uncharacterized protein n=1 Tax=Trichonephila inaurata madagascariensis TaxID=2747483 RepID=A0A8X6YY09_9ARAC|nr:hypothetical protein TNIN_190791 [Trichonephila inaurata madagascariensis]